MKDFVRTRRTREREPLRRMVRETRLSVDNFVYPLFAVPGSGVREGVPSMPGVHQLSVDELVEEAHELARLHVPAVILFGVPEEKDEVACLRRLRR